VGSPQFLKPKKWLEQKKTTNLPLP